MPQSRRSRGMDSRKLPGAAGRSENHEMYSEEPLENRAVIEPENAAASAVRYSEFAECEIPGELEAVRTAIEKLRTYCARFGLESKLWLEIELAVAEGLNNAIEHGCA